MKKVLSKILSLALLTLVITGVSTVELVPQAKEKISVSEKIDGINNKLIKYIETLNIENVTPSNIENFLTNNISDNEKLTGKELKEIINRGNKKVTTLKDSGYSSDEILESQIVKTVITENNFKVEIFDNGIFSIENLNNSIQSRSSSVWGQAYKDYYTVIGLHAFTVAVGSGFSYDGYSASYYGNFNAYYKRGIPSVWQVSGWEKGHEAAGTNYTAYASGNFHFGFEYDGMGLVIQDFYIKHKVTCDRYGNITPSYQLV